MVAGELNGSVTHSGRWTFDVNTHFTMHAYQAETVIAKDDKRSKPVLNIPPNSISSSTD